MNANLLSRLFLAWANLCLRGNELEQRVEEQAAEIFELKAQLQQEIAKCQQAEAALTQVQDKLEIDVTNLRLSEQLEALFEEALDAILIADEEGTYVEANPAACKLFGLPHSELLGKRITDFMVPGFDFALAWGNFLELGQATGELSLLRPDGTVREVEYAAKANFIPEQNLSILRDITERKQTERALTQERNFISAILDTATALIVVLDTQGKIIRFNRACEEMTGYSFKEVRGKYLWDLFLIPEEIESVKTVLQELQVNSSYNEHENYWVAQDGSRRLIRWSNKILQDIDHKVIADSQSSDLSSGNSNQSNHLEVSSGFKYIIGCGIDISDRQQAEEARQALAKEQELNQLRTNFFTMASHELRTPLSVVLLTVQSLEAFYYQWSEEKKLKKLGQIEEAAHRMKHLIDNILTLN